MRAWHGVIPPPPDWERRGAQNLWGGWKTPYRPDYSPYYPPRPRWRERPEIEVKPDGTVIIRPGSRLPSYPDWEDLPRYPTHPNLGPPTGLKKPKPYDADFGVDAKNIRRAIKARNKLVAPKTTPKKSPAKKKTKGSK